MRRPIAWLPLALLLLAVLGAACDDLRLAREREHPVDPAERPTPAPGPYATGTPAPVSAIPPEVEAAAHEWPLPNRDLANTRATTDSPIDSASVTDLEVAWTFPLGFAADWGAVASAPLIAGGVVYFQDLRSNVYALDLETGAELWRAVQDSAATGPNGPALGWGKVFAQNGEHHIFALTIDRGEELWRTSLTPHTGVHQPLVYGGYVLTGTGAGLPPAEAGHAGGRKSYIGGTSGFAYGLDQSNGHILWEFQVVEEGFWGNPEVNSGGALWYPPAVDVERRLTFWGTGNPAPFPGTVEYPNAESRPGPNLYTNAMIALNLASGDLVWFNQVKPRDLFDLDFQLSPILATVPVDGHDRDIVIGGGKWGVVFAFDRETGETLWRTPVGIHENDELQEIPLGEMIWVYPGVWGGIETPMAYADGTVYALTANLPTPYTATGHDAEDGAEAVAIASGMTRLDEGTAEFYAIDAADGSVRWSLEFDAPAFAGATVVNDLVFTALLDGRMLALSRDDGSVVWEHQAPGGVIAWPSVAGDTLIWPVGLGRDPQLIAFRLRDDAP